MNVRQVRARCASVILACMLFSISSSLHALPVFPGAVGFGTDTPAGRGGVVVRVTNLNDSGAGSLRDAVENDAHGYPRVVVFDVSGIIQLIKKIRIRDRFITVAGQTAPAPGIIVKGEGIDVHAGDVLIQHVSVWTDKEVLFVPDPNATPPLDSRGAFDVNLSTALPGISKVVLDHVSAGWTTDQIVATWSDDGTKLVQNVTYSNSIFAEALRHAGHSKGEHSAGPLFGRYSKGVSLIRSISAFNLWRNPLVRDKADNAQVVNNLVFWPRSDEKTNIYADASSAWTVNATARGNVYFLHPSTNTTSSNYAVVAKATTGNTLRLFVEDNRVYNFDGSGEIGGTGSPWSVVRQINQGGTITQLATQPTQFPVFPIVPARELEPLLFANAGARPAFRSPIDQRILNDIANRVADRGYGTDRGYVSDPDETGGYPNWQQVNGNFQENLDDDLDADGDGYTNLEERLHHIAFSLEGNARVVKLDNFEDGDANGWFTSPTPADWTVVTDGASKVLQQAGTGAEAQGYVVGSYFYEQTVLARVKPTAFNGTDRFVRVYARYRDPLHAYYVTLRSTNIVELKKLDGSVIPLASAPLPINVNDWYSVRLSVDGGVLAATVQNLRTQESVTLNHTDTNPLPPGHAAVGTFFASARFDDVLASPDSDASPLDLAVPKSDDFEDGVADGWTPSGTNDAWSVVLDGTNHVYRQDDMTFNARAVMNGTNWTDQVIEAAAKPLAFNGANRFFGLFARFTNIDNTYYFILRSNNTMELKKIVGGVTQPALGSGTLTVTPGTNYRLKLEAIGTSLKAYVNGALVLQATDSSFSSGRAALGTFMTQAQFDNVAVSPTAGTVVFSDNFEDGDALGWTPGGASAWSVVSDGSLVYRQTGTTLDAWSYAGTPIANQIVSTRAKALAFDGADRWFGIAARVVDTNNYYYVTVRSSNVIELKKLVAGTVVPLASAPLTVALNTWYDLRLEAIGSSIKASVNGQLLLEATDTTHASGTFGARMFRASAAYDDFSVRQP